MIKWGKKGVQRVKNDKKLQRVKRAAKSKKG